MTTTEMQAGREMDALVAEKVMCRSVTWLPTALSDSDPHCADAEGMRGWARVPSYCTDVPAAWQVVERLNRDERYPEMQFAVTEPHGDEMWRVTLVNPATPDYFARTFPLAICRAALAAVGAA